MDDSIDHARCADILEDGEFSNEPPPDVVLAQRHDSHGKVEDDHGRTSASTRVRSAAGTKFERSAASCASDVRSADRNDRVAYWISTRLRAARPIVRRRTGSARRSAM